MKAVSATSSTSSRSCRRSSKTFVHQPEQRAAIEVLVKGSLTRRSNRSVFLRNDDDQRVAFLAEAEGRAMPRAVSEFRIGRSGERQKRARGEHAIAVNDRRAVMQRSAGGEDAHQQFGGHDGID